MLEARERRTIIVAGSVLVAAFVFVYGVSPFARHWSRREEFIASRAEHIARLRWLTAHETELRQVAETRATHVVSAARPQLLAGRSKALAASQLQTLLQGYADDAGITVRQLNVSGSADSAGVEVMSIPATLTAVGDIHGVADFVSRVQHGGTLMEVREFGISPNPALRGELLQLSMTLRAAYALRESEQ